MLDKNENIYISVDTGKSHTKYAWFSSNKLDSKDIHADKFKSVVSETIPNSLNSCDTLTVYDGVTYDVGGDERSLESSNSKLSNHHKLCTYTAIAKSLLQMNMNTQHTYFIDLSINVPLLEFKTKKDDYIKKYKNQTVSLYLNNQKVDFIIACVRPTYEGSGAAVRNMKDGVQNIHIVDIGGKNDTHVSFEVIDSQLRPVKGKNGMFNNGVLTLLQHIASDLSDIFDVTIEDVEKIIEGKLNKPKGYDEVFELRASAHVASIKNQVQKYKLNPMFTQLTFAGGGSLLLQKQLKTAFSEYEPKFSKDSQFDNVKGALERVIG